MKTPSVPHDPWEAAGLSDSGRLRESNQDAFVILHAYHSVVVADGMGGHAGGGVASRVAVDAIAAAVRTGAPSPVVRHRHDARVERERALHAAILGAHEAVRRRASENRDLHGMGTTVVVARVYADPVPEAVVAHVGDSRAYLFRRGELVPLTRDHSLVEEYYRHGQLSREQIGAHPLRHVLSRAVGPDPDVEPESQTVALEPDDRLLLCTDGLTKMLSDPEIAQIVAHSADVQTTCSTLIEAANDRGGEDNVTVVVVRWAAYRERRNSV